MIKNVKPGDDIWVIDQYEEEPAGYIFVAAVGNYAIVTSMLGCGDNAVRDLIALLEYEADETNENMESDLLVFPLKDTFDTKAETQEAIDNGN